jgi:hypothetical protein
MASTIRRRFFAACPLSVVLSVFCVRLTAAPQSHVDGAISPGSTYATDVPDRWNGDLVLYAHGIVEPGRRIVPRTTRDGYGAARDLLLSQGYAAAASSCSSAGWALADAVQRTHQFGKVFGFQRTGDVGREPAGPGGGPVAGGRSGGAQAASHDSADGAGSSGRSAVGDEPRGCGAGAPVMTAPVLGGFRRLG